MTYALIVGNAIIETRARCPASARRLDTRQWVLALPTAGAELQAACGWRLVVDRPPPSVTASQVAESAIALVDGVPTLSWAVRAKTAAEVAADIAVTVRGDLHARARQALADNATFLAIASPTNAQTLAQVRRLTRQHNAVIRLLLALDGARDLLVASTDV